MEPAAAPQPTQHPNHIVTLLAWKAPGRPFKKRSRQYFLSGLLILLLLEIIFFLFGQYPLMAVAASLTFVAFVLASVPPHDFQYKISSEGVMIEDHYFLWQELYDFYFKKRYGVDILHIRTHAFIPGELTLTLGEVSVTHVKSVLLPYLPYREFVKPTFMEKASDWLTKNFPLESPDEHSSRHHQKVAS